MSRNLDHLVDAVLEDYSRVEPRPGAVAGWIEHRAESPRLAISRRWWPAVWAVAAAVLLVLLGLHWFRSQPLAPQPRLAGEPTHLRAVAPSTPLTAQQKQLLHLLTTDPAALSKLPANGQGSKAPQPR